MEYYVIVIFVSIFVCAIIIAFVCVKMKRQGNTFSSYTVGYLGHIAIDYNHTL